MEVESEEEDQNIKINRKKKIKKVKIDKIEKGTMKDKVLSVLQTKDWSS